MPPNTGVKDRDDYRSARKRDPSAESVCTGEMARVLTLWAAQIDAAISESHHELEDLSASYFSIANEATEALKCGCPDAKERAKAIEKQVHTALVKFQVSDRLMQRLMNVKAGLVQLGDLLQDEPGHIPHATWQQAREKIRDSYTMAAERRMFDAAVTQSNEPGADAVDLEETGHRLILFDEE